MRRRYFITLLGGAAAWPLGAQAQQLAERMRRLSVLINLAENDLEARPRVAALQQRLQELGWQQNRNIRIASWAARKRSSDWSRTKGWGVIGSLSVRRNAVKVKSDSRAAKPRRDGDRARVTITRRFT